MLPNIDTEFLWDAASMCACVFFVIGVEPGPAPQRSLINGRLQIQSHADRLAARQLLLSDFVLGECI